MTNLRMPLSVMLAAAVVCLGLGGLAFAQSRGTQLTREGSRVLANKDVGSERWALGLNEDGSATGNVFRLGGAPPAFLFCAPLGGNRFACSGADACVSGGQQRGIQASPDGRRILVNKDVGSERWAITLNLSDRTVTGNVFRSDGGSPAFLTCEPASGGSLDCYGADECRSDRCTDAYSFIANVTLPNDFFTPPTPCGSQYSFIADVTLPTNFFVPVRPTLEMRSLPSGTIPSGGTVVFEASADESADALVLQFDSGASLIGLDGLAFPAGDVVLDYQGQIDPRSPAPPYRVGIVPAPVSIVAIPNSPVLPLQAGSFQARIGNPLASPAAVQGSALVVRRSNTNVGRLDLRIYFVGVAGLDAAAGSSDPAAQFVISELNRKLGAAGVQLGTVTLVDYPADRAGALTLVDLDRDFNANGVADQIEEMFSLPRPMGQRTLDLFLVTDILGGNGGVIGRSGGIPGPTLMPPTAQSGVIAAVFEGIGAPQEAAALAQTIAHEIGHFLGLYHSTEAFAPGLGDPLVDTPLCTTVGLLPLEACPDASNLMFPQILSLDQSVVTPDQAFVLQRHPLVRDE